MSSIPPGWRRHDRDLDSGVPFGPKDEEEEEEEEDDEEEPPPALAKSILGARLLPLLLAAEPPFVEERDATKAQLLHQNTSSKILSMRTASRGNGQRLTSTMACCTRSRLSPAVADGDDVDADAVYEGEGERLRPKGESCTVAERF
jgi:hypothetical protein